MLKFIVHIHPSHPAGQSAAAVSPVTFDEAYAQLAILPRMFIEPDGSFVWRDIAEDGRQWQVDGNLIDRGQALDYIELKGCCPEGQFNELLQVVGWPDAPLSFSLPQQGVDLTEGELRRRAATPAGAS